MSELWTTYEQAATPPQRINMSNINRNAPTHKRMEKKRGRRHECTETDMNGLWADYERTMSTRHDPSRPDPFVLSAQWREAEKTTNQKRQAEQINRIRENGKEGTASLKHRLHKSRQQKHAKIFKNTHSRRRFCEKKFYERPDSFFDCCNERLQPGRLPARLGRSR